MKRIVFVDLRNKIKNETQLLKYINKSDVVFSLTPYSNYLLEKFKISFINFSKLKAKSQYHYDILNDYKKIENKKNFQELSDIKFLLRDVAKYITFDHYLRIIKKNVKNEYSIYISSCNSSISLGKDTLLNQFIKFSKTVILISDKGFYNRNRFLNVIKTTMGKSFLDLLNNILYSKNFNYDNKHNLKDYKKINLKMELEVDYYSINKLVEKFLNEIEIDTLLKKMLYNEVFSLLSKKKVDSSYTPFTFLSGVKLYSRFLKYKKNCVPTLFMQHGSYVHENYFLKYNEVINADANFVFNSYTKSLFEKLGAKNVHCVGSHDFNKKLRPKHKIYDYVYITYCTQYNYSGYTIGSKDFVVSPVAEDIYKRHKDVIEAFGKYHPEKKICIKVQKGIYSGNQMYIPFKELSEKYQNVKIEFSEPLLSLIEKSRYIISDYFSSEFSNRNILLNREIILFNDIIRITDKDVLSDLKSIFHFVNNISEMNEVIKRKKSTLNHLDIVKNNEVIDKYTTSNENMKLKIKCFINHYLNK